MRAQQQGSPQGLSASVRQVANHRSALHVLHLINLFITAILLNDKSREEREREREEGRVVDGGKEREVERGEEYLRGGEIKREG